MIGTLNQARTIASSWHGGQWSPLYSFASTGVIHHNISKYLKEIDTCLNGDITDSQRNELEDLKEYFEGCRFELQD